MLKPVELIEDDESLAEAMAAVASAMADASRLKILCALMDGRAWTATELSAVADISPSTASAHLSRLVNSGLLICLAQGRHRYYRLAGSDVAGLLENMMTMAGKRAVALATSTPVNLRLARTCYDHLAGEVAVSLYDFLQREAWITPDGTALTPAGKRTLRGWEWWRSAAPGAKPAAAVWTGANDAFILGVRRARRCCSTVWRTAGLALPRDFAK